MTLKGMQEVFVLVFLHVQTRRVILSPTTEYPQEAWVREQAETFVKQARSEGLSITYVQRDRDGKYAAGFDAALKRQRVKVIKGAVQ